MKKVLYVTLFIALLLFPKEIFAEEGWQEIGNEKYYIVEDTPVSGFKEIDGKLYFFSRINNTLKHGWQESDEGTWYQNQDGEVVTGLQTINQKTYYFDENGIQVRGFKEIEDKLYFFSRVNGVLKKGWQNAAEGTWYQNEEGEVVKGWQTIGKQKYYFDENGIQVRGFKEIEDKLYFFSRVNGTLKKGWQNADDGVWYQTEDGEVAKGWYVVDGKKYYSDENGIQVRGFRTIEDKLYFFSRANGALKRNWQNTADGVWYQNEEGEVVKGWQTIDGKKYYFDENGIQVRGFKEIEDKLYFFSRTNGALKEGWQNAAEGIWYQNEEGEVLKEWQIIDGKKYYFDENGIQARGFIEIGEKLYFFSKVNGSLKTGIQSIGNEAWYQTEDGEVVIGEGIIEIDGKELYFEGRYIKSGIIEIDGTNYYFDNQSYEKKYGNINKGNCKITLDEETGEFIKRQYYPVYYRQTDNRWSNKRYGSRTMGTSGCAPTAMAMAFTSILHREVLPTEVADYLYFNTDQFNKRLPGTSGMGIIYASNHYNVKWTGIGSKEDMIEALKEGKIIYASMQNGKFAKPTYNHIIITYDYNENTNQTYALDPLTPMNNGWTDVNLIWNEQCMDPDDRTGGYAFYSLEEK